MRIPKNFLTGLFLDSFKALLIQATKKHFIFSVNKTRTNSLMVSKIQAPVMALVLLFTASLALADVDYKMCSDESGLLGTQGLGWIIVVFVVLVVRARNSWPSCLRFCQEKEGCSFIVDGPNYQCNSNRDAPFTTCRFYSCPCSLVPLDLGHFPVTDPTCTNIFFTMAGPLTLDEPDKPVAIPFKTSTPIWSIVLFSAGIVLCIVLSVICCNRYSSRLESVPIDCTPGRMDAQTKYLLLSTDSSSDESERQFLEPEARA